MQHVTNVLINDLSEHVVPYKGMTLQVGGYQSRYGAELYWYDQVRPVVWQRCLCIHMIDITVTLVPQR